MDRRVYRAAITGSATLLRELLQQDENILERVANDCTVKENPLHVASQFGHIDFAKEISGRKPEYALQLNSLGLSPLHLASEKGHVEVVKLLLQIHVDACLLSDQKGRTPLHLAAMKGRVEVLKELVLAEPVAAWVLSSNGEPILHLCAKYNQFEAVKILVELMNDDEFVNVKDSDDNTVLHLLAPKKNTEVIKFLLDNARVKVNAMNVNKCTALDVLQQAPRQSNYMKVKRILSRAGAKRGKDLSQNQPILPSHNSSWKAHSIWLNEMKSTIMVVAVLIATVTFQVAMNPPGGVWQEDCLPTSCNSTTGYHEAGKAILSSNDPGAYLIINFFNQIGFHASTTIILLLISGFNVTRRRLMWVLIVSMWIAIGSMMVTYGVVFICLFDESSYNYLSIVMGFLAIFGSLVLVGPLMLAHIVRVIILLVKRLKIQIIRRPDARDNSGVTIQMPLHQRS